MKKLGALCLILAVLFGCNNKKVHKNLKTQNQCISIDSKKVKSYTDIIIDKNTGALTIPTIVPEHGLADAHTWIENDTLYMICGHDSSWDCYESFQMNRWEIWKTGDLKNWQYCSSILPTQTYIGAHANCWAGDICKRNNKYYWIFSNRNINTGIVEADNIEGPYTDVLGKPLLPSNIVPVHPYDPEFYIENGVYTVCFGSGTYYMAEMSEDMRSLKTRPKAIIVEDENGESMNTSDKSSLIKRGDWYYLVYGEKYAMSHNLYGPYKFMGPFLDGGHTSLFDWHGQYYVVQENHDISSCYRGISLKPVNFREDGSIIIPEDDKFYPGPGRAWHFKNSIMGWRSIKNSNISWKRGQISGEIQGSNAVIASAPWLYNPKSDCNQITVVIKNNTSSKKLGVSIYSKEDKNFWSSKNVIPDWDKEMWVYFDIKPNSKDFVKYTFDLSEYLGLKARLSQIALMPCAEAQEGSWMIKDIIIE